MPFITFEIEKLVSLFICPICRSPLQPAVDIWRCDASLNDKGTAHTFDVARQGYVNLLPVQQKKSKEPGDSQQSIAARQRFLQADHYQPLQALICEQIQNLLTHEQVADNESKAELCWLDVGCGEGYYTQAMIACGMDTLIAADISKSALIELAKVSKINYKLWYQDTIKRENLDEKKREQSQKASQQPPQKKTVIYPLVTSAAHLPVSAQSLNGISSIFSPILPEAFAKVLKDEGYLIIAKPDVGHLTTIRDKLFDEVREHDSDKFLVELAPFFTLLQTHRISTSLSLDTEALSDLLLMTPYAYRARLDKREALLASTEHEVFDTEAKFVIYILQKLNNDHHA